MRSPVFAFGLLALLSTLSILAASTAKSDALANKAKNVARLNCGAQIERITPLAPQNGEAAVLVQDDDTVSCSLPEGETEFVISLPRTSLLDRLTFLNENAAAAGELTISVSNYRLAANSPRWTRVEGTIPFAHKRTFDLSLLGIEAKFVKLSFRVEKSGNIAGVGLYGEQSLDEFAARQTHVVKASNTFVLGQTNDRLNFNFANLYARARVVRVSSGSLDAAQAMIDDDSASSFQFAANDPNPTVIVELSEAQHLHRVGAVYGMQSAALKVYGLKQMITDPAELDNMTPIATTVDASGEGKASVEFNPQGARYIALRWKPVLKSQRTTAFSVAEINAFGFVALTSIDTDSSAQLMAKNDWVWPGDGGPDFSNALGTLANPPVMPVSP